MVNLYKLYFLSSHFYFQPNKRVFHPSTFLPCQPNTWEKTKSFLSFHFSIFSSFSILLVFHSPIQTDPSLIVIHSSYGMCSTTFSEVKIKTFKQKSEVECKNIPIFVSILVESIFVSSKGIDCNLQKRI